MRDVTRTKVKRRKASASGRLASSSESPVFVGGVGVVATGSREVCWILPVEVCRVPRKAVGVRTKEQANRWPCRSRTGAQYPESHRKMALTPWEAMEGRESASGEGGGSKLEGLMQQDRQLLWEVAMGADWDLSWPSEIRDVVAV